MSNLSYNFRTSPVDHKSPSRLALYTSFSCRPGQFRRPRNYIIVPFCSSVKPFRNVCNNRPECTITPYIHTYLSRFFLALVAIVLVYNQSAVFVAIRSLNSFFCIMQRTRYVSRAHHLWTAGQYQDLEQTSSEVERVWHCITDYGAGGWQSTRGVRQEVTVSMSRLSDSIRCKTAQSGSQSHPFDFHLRSRGDFVKVPRNTLVSCSTSAAVLHKLNIRRGAAAMDRKYCAIIAFGSFSHASV